MKCFFPVAATLEAAATFILRVILADAGNMEWYKREDVYTRRLCGLEYKLVSTFTPATGSSEAGRIDLTNEHQRGLRIVSRYIYKLKTQ